MSSTKPLVLALDADPIGRDGSGNETYLRGIAGGLQDQLAPQERLVLLGSCSAALASTARGNTSVTRVPSGLRGELTWGRAAHRAGANVALGHYNAPVAFPGGQAVIIHDVAWKRVPETYPLGLRLRLEAGTLRAIRTADLIVTTSEFSRQELLDCYSRLDSDRVVVALSAPHARFSAVPDGRLLAEVRRRFILPERFALAVGNLQPRKNLAAAAEACHRVGIPLVIAGRPIWGGQSPEQGALGAQWLGYVEDEVLPILYRLSQLLVYPSLYEGFGLPVVEAMAAGTPVVCSSTSALPETAGGAALLVEPTNVNELEEAIALVASDDKLARSLSAAGTARVASLSWEESARHLIEALRQLLQAGKLHSSVDRIRTP